MKKNIITNDRADKTLERLITGDVIKTANYDQLCRSYLINHGPEFVAVNSDKLSDSEIKLLGAVVKSPMLKSSEYIKLAHISPNTFSKISGNLLEQDYIQENIISNTHGRPAKLWQPAEKAIEFINKLEQQNER